MKKFSYQAIIKRDRVKHEKTFQQREAAEAAQFKQLADRTPHGM